MIIYCIFFGYYSLVYDITQTEIAGILQITSNHFIKCHAIFSLWCFFSLLLQRFPPEEGSDHGCFRGTIFKLHLKTPKFSGFSQYSLHCHQQYMLESTANDTSNQSSQYESSIIFHSPVNQAVLIPQNYMQTV